MASSINTLTRLFVFDLDGTLFNWKTHDLYPDAIDILKRLSCDKRNLLALATHNLDPEPILKKTNIYNYFSCIVYGRGCTKDHMILEIAKRLDISCWYNTVYFADDQLANLSHVHLSLPMVKCIWASDGLDLEDMVMAGAMG